MTEAEERAALAWDEGCEHLENGICEVCVLQYLDSRIQQAISQAEARTLAAAMELVQQRLDVYEREKEAGTESGVMLQTIVERLANLQPSSDALKGLLRKVAERVLDETGYHSGTLTRRAIDLDRIVEEEMK